MAPKTKKKSGRAAAEAAYANLLSEHTALVGDVGEAFDTYVAKLNATIEARDDYERARAAAIKGGAVTNDHLEQMGYKRLTKLPAPPVSRANSDAAAPATTQVPAGPVQSHVPSSAVPQAVSHERALV